MTGARYGINANAGMHVVDLRHDRGRGHALQLGQPIDQPTQM